LYLIYLQTAVVALGRKPDRLNSLDPINTIPDLSELSSVTKPVKPIYQSTPRESSSHKFTIETAQLEVNTQTEWLLEKSIITQTGFLGFKKQVEVEKLVKVEKPRIRITEDLGDEVKLEMVYIPAGSFMMGSNKYPNESPIHQVTLRPFYMGKYPITQQQYQAIIGKNPSHFKGNSHPVEQVSWHDARKFCEQLSQSTRKTYTLPSESQWEYACQTGTTNLDETITPNLAEHWSEYQKYPKNSQEQTMPVGKLSPNPFGLYDLHGNVCQWCLDTWHENYKGAPNNGSAWIDYSNYNSFCLLRGEVSHISPPAKYISPFRSTKRFYHTPANRDNFIGFRVVVNL
jgi:formylglycine-generating enzyme required for sulfatase activity